jgi:hypothetical protein
MLNKSRLKERKDKNEERKIQKKLRKVAREEKDRRKRVKTGYRKIHINGGWFIWDEREEKLKKNIQKKERRVEDEPAI